MALIKSAKILYQEFQKNRAQPMGEKLKFIGVEGYDVYNITAPFRIGNETFIAGRVEKRDSWAESITLFFKQNNDVWEVERNLPALNLEDPFVSFIDGEIILGGVEVYSKPPVTKETRFRTVFYRGKDLASLQRFAQGPDLMKDIRLLELNKNKIAVFTRPQGGKYERGKIGYIEISSLKDLNHEDLLLGAEIIENQFFTDEWGGANELHLLADGKIGVLGHIAYMDENQYKHYFAMAFIYDTKTHCATPLEIIASRRNFPPGESKREDLVDVIFPGGIVRDQNGEAMLFAGLSDAEAGMVKIKDPFCKS